VRCPAIKPHGVFPWQPYVEIPYPFFIITNRKTTLGEHSFDLEDYLREGHEEAVCSLIMLIIGHYIDISLACPCQYRHIVCTNWSKSITKLLGDHSGMAAASLRSWSFSFFLMAFILAISCKSLTAFRPSQWYLAHATFYGDESASATMGT
jgi:hypothetical protein